MEEVFVKGFDFVDKLHLLEFLNSAVEQENKGSLA